MKKIIAVMLISIVTIICFGACVSNNQVQQPQNDKIASKNETTKSEPKQEMLTIGIGQLQRNGSDLNVAITIREIAENEVNAPIYPAGKTIIVNSVYVLRDGIPVSTSSADGILSSKGSHQLNFKNFFAEINPKKLDKTVKAWISVIIDDKEFCHGKSQEFAIK